MQQQSFHHSHDGNSKASVMLLCFSTSWTCLNPDVALLNVWKIVQIYQSPSPSLLINFLLNRMTEKWLNFPREWHLQRKNWMSYSLLGGSPVTNKCLQGGAFCDISWFSSAEMQLLRQSCSSLNKQTLPTKIPGCFAPAPTTHQTWPDTKRRCYRELGGHPSSQGKAAFHWLFVCRSRARSWDTILKLLPSNEPNWDKRKNWRHKKGESSGSLN